MKKYFLISLLFSSLWLVATNKATSQTIEVMNQDTLVYGSIFDTDLIAHALVKNTGTDTVNIITSVHILNLLEGYQYYFCDSNLCYPPISADWAVKQPYKLAPGMIFYTFHLDLSRPDNIQGKNGNNQLEVIMTDKNNPTNKMSYIVTFQIGVSGVVETLVTQETPTPSPNPANNSINIGIPGNVSGIGVSTLSIYNTTGEKVGEYNYDGGMKMANINVSSYPSGMFFYTIESNGTIVAKNKFIVQH